MKDRVRVGAFAVLAALASSPLSAQGVDPNHVATYGTLGPSIFSTGDDRISRQRIWAADCPDPQGGAQARTPDDTWGCWASLAESNPFSGSWLDVRIKPTYSLVYINDKYVGTAQQFTKPFRPLRVGAGPQKVEFRAPGYRTVSFWINNGNGGVTTASGALIKNP